jgi:hypothetical protein
MPFTSDMFSSLFHFPPANLIANLHILTSVFLSYFFIRIQLLSQLITYRIFFTSHLIIYFHRHLSFLLQISSKLPRHHLFLKSNYSYNYLMIIKDRPQLGSKGIVATKCSFLVFLDDFNKKQA